MAEAITAIPAVIMVVLLVFFQKMLMSAPTNDVLASVETAQRWNRAEDEDDERRKKWLLRALLLMYGCVTFGAFLLGYCFVALFCTPPLWLFVYLQAAWLYQTVKGVLASDPNPGPAKIFTTLK